jgi:hypothetical protein
MDIQAAAARGCWFTIAVVAGCTQGRTPAPSSSASCQASVAAHELSSAPASSVPAYEGHGEAVTPPANSGPIRPSNEPSPPFMGAIEVFLKKMGGDAAGEDKVVVLVPNPTPETPVVASEPLFVALSLAADQGFGAGRWSLFAVVGREVRSLGAIESPNMKSVRLFRTKPGTAIFRRFWFQVADPTPEERHKGTFDDVELTVGGQRPLSKGSPIDLHSKQGSALWKMPDGIKYVCDVASSRPTGNCKLAEPAE